LTTFIDGHSILVSSVTRLLSPTGSKVGVRLITPTFTAGAPAGLFTGGHSTLFWRVKTRARLVMVAPQGAILATMASMRTVTDWPTLSRPSSPTPRLFAPRPMRMVIRPVSRTSSTWPGSGAAIGA
jgi:hypothetical protein